MKLNLKAYAISGGIIWAGIVFIFGLLNLFWSSYAANFVQFVKSLYPGYKAMSGFLGVIVGSIYALTHGAVLGVIFAWIYNAVLPKKTIE